MYGICIVSFPEGEVKISGGARPGEKTGAALSGRLPEEIVGSALPGQHLLVVPVILLQQAGSVQAVGALGHAGAAVEAVRILPIFSCHSGVSQPSAGARRSMRDMRAQLLISMPAGQGMQ